MFFGAMMAACCLVYSVSSLQSGGTRSNVLDILFLTLAGPGFFLSLPLYFILGGVRGNFFNIVQYTVIPLNAVGYGLLFVLFRLLTIKVYKYFQGADDGNQAAEPPY